MLFNIFIIKKKSVNKTMQINRHIKYKYKLTNITIY